MSIGGCKIGPTPSKNSLKIVHKQMAMIFAGGSKDDFLNVGQDKLPYIF